MSCLRRNVLFISTVKGLQCACAEGNGVVMDLMTSYYVAADTPALTTGAHCTP
ncbi:hypothetical protein KIN20_022755 [Parelaphostrongylus tenuis]|uniref:Uncharacterized protein n=1 Tax=Parelaphostrongylus tenuis TaxID=148309 RepID=A0AAD5QWZ9_PARTN|nr:hypothetical protein KIN20_022755 [Parelaphostrongylus tenuis]